MILLILQRAYPLYAREELERYATDTSKHKFRNHSYIDVLHRTRIAAQEDDWFTLEPDNRVLVRKDRKVIAAVIHQRATETQWEDAHLVPERLPRKEGRKEGNASMRHMKGPEYLCLSWVCAGGVRGILPRNSALDFLRLCFPTTWYTGNLEWNPKTKKKNMVQGQQRRRRPESDNTC